MNRRFRNKVWGRTAIQPSELALARRGAGKHMTSESIAADVQRFLAGGGEVEEVPGGKQLTDRVCHPTASNGIR